MQVDGPGAKQILAGTIKVWEVLCHLKSDRHITKRTVPACMDYKDDRGIEEAIRLGQLRAYRIGKRALVKKSELDAWIRRYKVTLQRSRIEKNELQKLVDGTVECARKGAA